MFNYFPLLIFASFNPSFAFASSLIFAEVNNAQEDLELPMFQVKYLFLLALFFLCFIAYPYLVCISLCTLVIHVPFVCLSQMTVSVKEDVHYQHRLLIF